MPLINVTVQHQLDQKTRDLLVQQITALLASQHAALLQKVIAQMSVLDDKISAIGQGVAGLTPSIEAVGAAVAALKAAPTEPTADQLAALDAIGSSVAGAKASLDAIFPPPPPLPEPEPVVDPNAPTV